MPRVIQSCGRKPAHTASGKSEGVKAAASRGSRGLHQAATSVGWRGAHPTAPRLLCPLRKSHSWDSSAGHDRPASQGHQQTFYDQDTVSAFTGVKSKDSLRSLRKPWGPQASNCERNPTHSKQTLPAATTWKQRSQGPPMFALLLVTLQTAQ